MSPATELKQLPMDLRPPANQIHMVPGFKDNLLSTSKFVNAGYVWIFDQDKVCVYDMDNTKITTSCTAIMKGWCVPKEGVWRFPLLPTEGAPIFDSKRSPQEILRAQPPPLWDKILNVYNLKTKPELIRYHHAGVGFPTKPTWLKAIKDDHYKSWPGLDITMAAKYFLESVKTWRGHGRKKKYGQRPTQQPVLEEETEPELPTSEGGRALFVKTYNLQHDFDKKNLHGSDG